MSINIKEKQVSYSIPTASFHLKDVKVETDVFNSDLKMTFYIFSNILLNKKFSEQIV